VALAHQATGEVEHAASLAAQLCEAAAGIASQRVGDALATLLESLAAVTTAVRPSLPGTPTGRLRDSGRTGSA